LRTFNLTCTACGARECRKAYEENMELDSAAIGLLIIILLVIGANFVMYAIARGATRGGKSRWLSSLKDSLSKPMNTPANQSMDELRKRVEELEKEKKQDV